jgi:hypothetical protein
MTSPGWLIGIFMLFFSLGIMANVFSEVSQPLSSTDINTFAEGDSATIMESSQGITGGTLAFLNATSKVWRFVWCSLTANYAFFYDYDAVTHIKTPNQYYIFRFFFLCLQYGIMITLTIVAFRYT